MYEAYSIFVVNMDIYSEEISKECIDSSRSKATLLCFVYLFVFILLAYTCGILKKTILEE